MKWITAEQHYQQIKHIKARQRKQSAFMWYLFIFEKINKIAHPYITAKKKKEQLSSGWNCRSKFLSIHIQVENFIINAYMLQELIKDLLSTIYSDLTLYKNCSLFKQCKLLYIDRHPVYFSLGQTWSFKSICSFWFSCKSNAPLAMNDSVSTEKSGP